MHTAIENVIATTLKIPRSAVVDGLEYYGASEWDSMGHMQLMLALEAEYGVTIDDDTILELTSVKAIRSYIESLKNGSGEAT